MLTVENFVVVLCVKPTKCNKITQKRVPNEPARRDLEVLQDQKLVTRVYGGAILTDRRVKRKDWRSFAMSAPKLFSPGPVMVKDNVRSPRFGYNFDEAEQEVFASC